MTDAKELAAKLRREAECDAHNAARDSTAGRHTWANECAASAAIKNEAADALEALAAAQSPLPWVQNNALAIAVAVAAERERCAKIAEASAAHWKSVDPSKEVWSVEQMTMRCTEATYLAAAIRAGEKT